MERFGFDGGGGGDDGCSVLYYFPVLGRKRSPGIYYKSSVGLRVYIGFYEI